jgi:hypothetical protein
VGQGWLSLWSLGVREHVVVGESKVVVLVRGGGVMVVVDVIRDGR